MVDISVIAGIGAGIVYGLFFLYQRGRAFSFVHNITGRQQSITKYVMALATLFATMRIAFLALFLACLLRYYKISGISFSISFLSAFWLLIINAKAFRHGKRSSGGD